LAGILDKCGHSHTDSAFNDPAAKVADCFHRIQNFLFRDEHLTCSERSMTWEHLQRAYGDGLEVETKKFCPHQRFTFKR
jgi:hypothetical protein